MSDMHVIVCQLDSVWEDKPANHAQVRRMLDGVNVPRGSLIVLPEMFATGFSMDVAKIDEGHDRPTERFLGELAREYGAAVLGGVVHRAAGRDVAGGAIGCNQAVALGPDGALLARYSKLHPFTPGGEAKHYQAGDRIAVFDWQGFAVAPFICYDLRFPEAFRHAAMAGAQLLVVIANFPTARLNHWLTLLVARAIENQAYVVGVNRWGADATQSYPGHSLVVDPKGRIMVDAGEGAVAIGADLDRQALVDYRAAFPLLKDIRQDLLGEGL